MADRLLVLDTHVWVWIVTGEREALSDNAIGEIEEASHRGNLLIPAICIWELAILDARGRLTLTRPIVDWVRLALRARGVRLLDLTPEIAIASTRLPGPPHGDPADRMIIASARSVGARLATRDRRILDYAAQGHVAVLNANP
ncbi:MAG: type II toxin-antitoxin system VapC family toxin [Gemmatimonadota bacterium]